MSIDFRAAISALTAPVWTSAQPGQRPTGHDPFRWQQRLSESFARGATPDACDIPTGLGKTSVMAIWLAALDLRAPKVLLPRRLIYVVDRRAVVDQATEEARMLAENLGDGTGTGAPPIVAELRGRLQLGPGRRLPVSTLRGQLADNRAWLDDPSAPAIVVGTVDMIGSRLLFSGYGVSPGRRPVHAALLGVDALIVLDEAHLVPPFQALIEQVAGQTRRDCERANRSEATPLAIAPMRTMALSATGRETTQGRTFALTPEDVDGDEIVRQRVNASKRLRLRSVSSGLVETMAARAFELAAGRHRVIVFCNSRKLSQDIYDRLEKLLGKDAALGSNLELIVGARRVREREQLADSAVFRRFARLPPKAGQTATGGAAFLVATSAGEVGVDLDAEHMVCDLVPWERMVQRLGRVNRRGDCAESLIDVYVAEPDKEAETPPGTPAIETCRKPFESPSWATGSDGRLDASPGTLRRLVHDAAGFKVLTAAATTGEPLRPRLKQEDVAAWAMTSLETHTGRPDVSPWIRGWIDDETPQTEVLWRELLPIRKEDSIEQATRELAAFLDAAPPHLSEILQTEAFRVVDMLRTRAKTLLKRKREDSDDDLAPASENGEDADSADNAAPQINGRTIVAIVLEADRSIRELLRLDDIQNRDAKRLQSLFANHRVVLDARLGGLATSGLLDAKEDDMPATLDGERVANMMDEGGKRLWSDERLSKSGLGFRVRKHDDDGKEKEKNWKLAYRRAVKPESDDADEAAARLEWRVEEWVGDGAAENESSLTGTRQALAWHHERIEHWADRIAEGLRLPDGLRDMLVTAARFHDRGKARAIWQRFAGNPGFARDPANHPALAKFTTRGDPRLLKVGDGTYRHEFGSVLDAIDDRAFDHLPPPLRALGLRLIAAHHGYARPAIFAYDEKHPDGEKSQRVAGQLVLEFAALQTQWGAWGLAWWESLLRAADVAASRENSPQEAR